jgi:hypothetical protein
MEDSDQSLEYFLFRYKGHLLGDPKLGLARVHSYRLEQSRLSRNHLFSFLTNRSTVHLAGGGDYILTLGGSIPLFVS